MRRIVALLQETWWLWVFFYGSCISLTLWVEPFMIVTIPLITGILIYFAVVRFDDEGKRRLDQ